LAQKKSIHVAHLISFTRTLDLRNATTKQELSFWACGIQVFYLLPLPFVILTSSSSSLSSSSSSLSNPINCGTSETRM
jgi:hypothetical protein